jgi:protein disulfide-isomerase
MKHLLSTLVLLVISTSLSFADNPAWGHDWEVAKTRAKAENKPILLFMTGSDWCTWCMKLEREVITQKEFEEFAAEHFVLMEANYPKTKEQPAAVKKQNAVLKKEYLNGGYPTMLVVDAEGKKLSEDLGELEGGIGGYIAKLKELLKEIKK